MTYAISYENKNIESMLSKNLLPVFKLKVSYLIDQNIKLGMEK